MNSVCLFCRLGESLVKAFSKYCHFILNIKLWSGSFVPHIPQSLQRYAPQRSLLWRNSHLSGPHGEAGLRMSCCDLPNLSGTRWLDSHLDPGRKRENLTMIGWHRAYISVTHVYTAGDSSLPVFSWRRLERKYRNAGMEMPVIGRWWFIFSNMKHLITNKK